MDIQNDLKELLQAEMEVITGGIVPPPTCMDGCSKDCTSCSPSCSSCCSPGGS